MPTLGRLAAVISPVGGGRGSDRTGPKPRLDPDVDLRVPADRHELAARPAAILGAVAAGGAIGALARAAVGYAVPPQPTAFAWGTFAVNVSGCFLIGVLMAALPRLGRGRPLLRPFLGVGVLGGYTTFATYAVDARTALTGGAPWTAGAYLGATLTAALLAVWLGDALTRRLPLGTDPPSDAPHPSGGAG